ncbi:DNA-binding transcriptional activator BglJ [Pseudescherichia sp.]|uniref:DNA-binding transcriptional activator BglJ n=1 Tax=Pseudescherichia sp. TaxID=2055881 RepID=UPI00289F51DB|nr:DNA-binding transcriptional activator BglJ [Pseudescherichia sp.]
MENSGTRKHVAIIEQCAISEIGLKQLFSQTANERFQFHFFKDYSTFLSAMVWTPFISLIYSLSGIRAQRLECLKALNHMERHYPDRQRIVLAGNEMEQRLISRFSPTTLHGILSKTTPLATLQEQLWKWLNDSQPLNDIVLNLWYYSYDRVLSQAERDIIYYTTEGYSTTDIAHYSRRNIKLIRAYKLSLMMKLDVRTDAELLYAADILIQMQKTLNDPTAPQRRIPA